MEEDLPMKRLSELFNVNHFIVSQGIFRKGLREKMSGKRESWI